MRAAEQAERGLRERREQEVRADMELQRWLRP
jgi:hypothetical protein